MGIRSNESFNFCHFRFFYLFQTFHWIVSLSDGLKHLMKGHRDGRPVSKYCPLKSILIGSHIRVTNVFTSWHIKGLLDGLSCGLYTAPCRIRAKWPSGRCAPLSMFLTSFEKKTKLIFIRVENNHYFLALMVGYGYRTGFFKCPPLG